jgi:hypothetical protein
VQRGIESAERVRVRDGQHLSHSIGEEAVTATAQMHEVLAPVRSVGKGGMQIGVDQDRTGAGGDARERRREGR